MNQSAQPLIVGTGPVGKAAALFLAREGIPTPIIDSAEHPSEHSKAGCKSKNPGDPGIDWEVLFWLKEIQDFRAVFVDPYPVSTIHWR